MVKRETYINYLRRANDYYSDSKIVYVPHPREDQTMVSMVRTEVGFEIRSLDVPIEYYLARVRPKCLISFFCSALENAVHVWVAPLT